MINIKDHKPGSVYSMTNRNGSSSGLWKIVYYPLPGTWEGGKWVDFDEPRALIEQPMIGRPGVTDFREIPLRYLETATAV